MRITDDLTTPDQDRPRGILPETGMVRICECGEKNPVGVRKCTRCGEDLTGIAPVADKATPLGYALVSLDGKYRYELCEPRVIIGRACAMKEYLADKLFVSRNQAILIVENGRLYLENLSKTNYTYVNNVRVAEGMVSLKDGDEVGLGGNLHQGVRQKDAAYFVVRKEA